MKLRPELLQIGGIENSACMCILCVNMSHRGGDWRGGSVRTQERQCKPLLPRMKTWVFVAVLIFLKSESYQHNLGSRKAGA